MNRPKNAQESCNNWFTETLPHGNFSIPNLMEIQGNILKIDSIVVLSFSPKTGEGLTFFGPRATFTHGHIPAAAQPSHMNSHTPTQTRCTQREIGHNKYTPHTLVHSHLYSADLCRSAEQGSYCPLPAHQMINLTNA